MFACLKKTAVLGDNELDRDASPDVTREIQLKKI
jgi:hypothetical protein